MDINIFKWVFFGLVASAVIIWVILSFFKRKARQIENGDDHTKSDKITCGAINCGIWYSALKNKSKYCEFHDDVSKLHLELINKHSESQKKSNMYMSVDARSLSGNQKDKIISELKKYINKK